MFGHAAQMAHSEAGHHRSWTLGDLGSGCLRARLRAPWTARSHGDPRGGPGGARVGRVRGSGSLCGVELALGVTVSVRVASAELYPRVSSAKIWRVMAIETLLPRRPRHL